MLDSKGFENPSDLRAKIEVSSATLSEQTVHERSWIEVRTDRLYDNLQALRQIAGKHMHIMAVVKANAYGHGLSGIARALTGKVDYFGVASINEALLLKESGTSTPIFLFGRLLHHEIPLMLQTGITLSISSLDEARQISEASETVFRRTPVHIKVDTGMGRMGISYSRALKEIPMIAELPGLFLEGIYTHFPTAEQADGFSERQLADFEKLIMALDKKNIRFTFRHAANSAGTVKFQSSFLNMARPGLMLYGLYPDESLKSAIHLAPCLSFKTRIILIKDLREGDSVGYGRQYIAGESTRIAILPIGYSHGYPLSASNKSFCLLHGKRFPVAGRISMDYLAVDLGQEPAKIGEEITLLGGDGSEAISAEEMAGWAKTIPYEVVTRLSSQMPRFYHPSH